jgi:hypothetical protein
MVDIFTDNNNMYRLGVSYEIYDPAHRLKTEEILSYKKRRMGVLYAIAITIALRFTTTINVEAKVCLFY